jgi:hypothetical protein
MTRINLNRTMFGIPGNSRNGATVRREGPGRATHFLELVFGIPVNQGKILDNLYAMRDGEQGSANQARLLQACCFTSWNG